MIKVSPMMQSDATNELQDISTDGNAGNLTLSDGSTITLNVNDGDSDSTNELQDISTNGNAGNVSLSDGSTLNLNINDADSDATNEIQTITSNDGTLTVTKTGDDYDIGVAVSVYSAGKVNADGTAAKIHNATSAKLNTGDYEITFDTALPDANYIIQLSLLDRAGSGNDDPGITYHSQSTTGFSVNIGDNDNGGTDRSDFDSEFMFTIIRF